MFSSILIQLLQSIDIFNNNPGAITFISWNNCAWGTQKHWFCWQGLAATFSISYPHYPQQILTLLLQATFRQQLLETSRAKLILLFFHLVVLLLHHQGLTLRKVLRPFLLCRSTHGLDDLMQLVQIATSFKESPAHRQLCEDAANRPDVNGSAVPRKPQENFRGSVP